MSEEASQLLQDFVASLDNLPSEVQHILQEVAHKEHRFQEHRSRISQRDGSIQKHHKTSGLLVENVKEASHVNKCRTDFSKAAVLADEKVELAERGVRLLTRHLGKLTQELAKLQGIPQPSISSDYGLPPGGTPMLQQQMAMDLARGSQSMLLLISVE